MTEPKIRLGLSVSLWAYVPPLLLVAGVLSALSAGHVLPNMPSIPEILLWCGCLALVLGIRSRYTRLIMLLWWAWYGIGSASLVARSLERISIFSSHAPDGGAFGVIYLLFLLAALLGATFNERLVRSKGARDHGFSYDAQESSTPTVLLLSIFPLAYVLSLYLWAGYIPLLSGRNVVGEMYTTNFGPLRGYAIVAAVSSVYLTVSIMRRYPDQFGRTLGLAIFVATAALASADGRRVVTLTAALAGLLWWFGSQSNTRSTPHLAAGLAGAMAFYLFGEILRMGGLYNSSSSARVIGTFGVEYATSAYLVNYLTVEQVESLGYDWVRSTVASVLNGSLLSLFGVDKQAWVQLDSARIFMAYFSESLGVRVGLPTELWFAFGPSGSIGMAAMGFLVSRTADIMTKTKTLLGRSFIGVLLATLGLCIMGQSTSVFGSLPTLAYAYIIMRSLDYLSIRRAGPIVIDR